jgi:hypothetical protein
LDVFFSAENLPQTHLRLHGSLIKEEINKMTTPGIDQNGFTPMKAGQQQPVVAPQPLVYGKILLQLTNCLLPEEKLSPTPSELDGLAQDVEIDLRILGCELIQTAGMLLKLPQVGRFFPGSTVKVLSLPF